MLLCQFSTLEEAFLLRFACDEKKGTSSYHLEDVFSHGSEKMGDASSKTNSGNLLWFFQVSAR